MKRVMRIVNWTMVAVYLAIACMISGSWFGWWHYEASPVFEFSLTIVAVLFFLDRATGRGT